MSGVPDYESIWKYCDCFCSPSKVEGFLLRVKDRYESMRWKLNKHINDHRLIYAMLNEMGRVLLDEGKKETESIKKYKIWRDAAEVISAGDESMALFADATAQIKKILECYRQNRLMDGFKTANELGKRYLIDLILFPTTEVSSVAIDTLLNEAKQNEEDVGMVFLRLSLATECVINVVNKKESIRYYRIEGEHVDDYYLKKIDMFSREMAITLKWLGNRGREDRYRKQWKSLAETLGKMMASPCQLKLDAFINDWEKLYQQMKEDGKKMYHMPSNRLLQKRRYKKKANEYEQCRTEYRRLENGFEEVVRTYKEKLNKKYQAVKCCGDAEYGQLLEESRKACEEFLLEIKEAENAVSLAVQNRNAAFDKAKNLLEELKKREAVAKEKEKKASARKRFTKKHCIKVLVVLALIGFGIFFFYRYMTSTYYGTAFYLGKLFDYEEYTIAESTTIIASNAFQGIENLRTIEIPDTVEQIGEFPFHMKRIE